MSVVFSLNISILYLMFWWSYPTYSRDWFRSCQDEYKSKTLNFHTGESLIANQASSLPLRGFPPGHETDFFPITWTQPCSHFTCSFWAQPEIPNNPSICQEIQ